jgi:transcriptional regulator with XRE-family HTH domain
MDVKPLKEIISRKLTFLLKKSGKTLNTTADDLQMPLSQYYRLLKGQRLPLLPTFVHISRAYGMSLDWWFKDIESRPKQIETAENPIEYQLFKTLKGFDPRGQKIALALLKTLAKSLKN